MTHIKVKENESITRAIVESMKGIDVRITDNGHIYINTMGPLLIVSSELLLDLGERLSTAVSEDFSLSVGIMLAYISGEEMMKVYKSIVEEVLNIKLDSLNREEFIQRILEAHISNFKSSNYFGECTITLSDSEILIQMRRGLAEKYVKTKGKDAKKPYAIFIGYYLGFVRYLLGIEKEKEAITKIRNLKDGFSVRMIIMNS